MLVGSCRGGEDGRSDRSPVFSPAEAMIARRRPCGKPTVRGLCALNCLSMVFITPGWADGSSLAQESRRGTGPSRTMASDDPGPGNPARGQSVFDGKNGCTSCHRVVDRGSRTGPDLTDIGTQRPRVYLEPSLLDPDAEVLPQNRYYTVVIRDGTSIHRKAAEY